MVDVLDPSSPAGHESPASDVASSVTIGFARPRQFRGGLKLGLNEFWTQGGSFVRSVIIARLITPQDFGIAATLSLTYVLLQMISNLSAEKLLVQADNGDERALQDVAHVLQVLRGFAAGVVLLAIGRPIAQLFGAPYAAWAFQCLALIPIVRGLAHTDIFRFQRVSNFGPYIRVNVWSTLVATVVSLPLALWLHNYAVMVWVLVIQSTCSTVLTHVVAERTYRWSWDRNHFRQITTFGWPLLINGGLMYLIFQGDRMVIGASNRMFSLAHYSLSDLAVYSLAFSVAQMPAMLVANVCTSLFLPVLSRARAEVARFNEDYLACSIIVSLAAVVTSSPMIIAGGWLVRVIYGADYGSADTVIGWLAATQAVRVIRVAPALGAMALGDTTNAMMSNLVRTPAFILVLLVAAAGGSLGWVAACGVAGELLALGFSLGSLWRRHRIAPRLCLGPSVFVAIGLSAAAFAHAISAVNLDGIVAVISSLGLVVIISSMMLLAYPRLRGDLQSLVEW